MLEFVFAMSILLMIGTSPIWLPALLDFCTELRRSKKP